MQSVHYIEECYGWVLVIRHDNESMGNAVNELVTKITEVEDLFGRYLEPHVLDVSSKQHDAKDQNPLFERPTN